MSIIKERKSFICELHKTRITDDDLFTISNETNLFSHVWIQGVVYKIYKDEDYIILDDYTGVARIENCSRMPNTWQDLNEGTYVMIIGQFVDNFNLNSNKIITVKTIKIQILNNPKLELCWPLEVIEANS